METKEISDLMDEDLPICPNRKCLNYGKYTECYSNYGLCEQYYDWWEILTKQAKRGIIDPNRAKDNPYK